MCTVSFIPVRDKVIITSNRDERLSRQPAIAPLYCSQKGQLLLCPVDAEKGGTWIALKENGDAAVLLNGAFENHLPSDKTYSRSRGSIIPEVLAQEYPSLYFTRLSLEGVEPFTLLLYERRSLYEFRWDGKRQHGRQFSASGAHLWSSATLYGAEAAAKRKQWFASFLHKHPVPTQLDILRFHREAGAEDPMNALCMRRGDQYQTVSTTSILLCQDRGCMTYTDYRTEQTTTRNIELIHNHLAA